MSRFFASSAGTPALGLALMVGGLLCPAAVRAAPPAAPGELTITEFMAEPLVIPNYYGEWFEIRNNTDHALELFGLRVEGDSATDEGFTIDEALVLAAGDSLVLGVDGDLTENGGVGVDYVYDRSLSPLEHTGDTLQLVMDGLILDTVTWDSSEWDVVLQRAYQVNVNALGLEWANDLPQNWCQAPNETIDTDFGWYGTPGTENPMCDDSNRDVDGDGVTEANGDCNDEDPYVNPDAVDGDTTPYGDANDDADCDGVRDDGAFDDDGDGFAETDGDCDDTDIRVNPDEQEVVDSIDNDCNGCVDDTDDDLDGYTTCDTGRLIDCDPDDTFSCSAGALGRADYVQGLCAYAFDCVEGDNDIFPCAVDPSYDGVDQSCDGLDYCDVDGDGFDADPTHCVDGADCCLNPVTGAPGADCDDQSREATPTGDEGDPANGGLPDGVDNDCDGVVDDPYQDLDGDGFTASDGDCADEGEGAVTINPGAPELCGDGLDNDCDGFLDDGCEDPLLYATVRGGGALCGVGPLGSAPGRLALLALALLAPLARRARPNASSLRGGARE
jgi:hypothetical protein